MAFTPDSTRTAAEQIQTEWIAAGRPRLEAGCWWRIHIVATFERPASHFRVDGQLSAQGRRRTRPTKPDGDNIMKLACDALVRCGAVPDDARAAEMRVAKVWGPVAQTVIEVEVIRD